MKHMSLDEWDKKVAPYLTSICVRATWLINDARKIREWIDCIPTVPNFETEAQDKLRIAKEAVTIAMVQLERAIDEYSKKPKVT